MYAISTAGDHSRWMRRTFATSLLLVWLLTGCGAANPDIVTEAAPSSVASASAAANEHHHHATSNASALPTAASAATPTAGRATSTPIIVTPTVAPATAITLRGSGEQASANFTLRAGLALFHYDHPTSTPFGMFLMNAHGDHLALLANGAALDGTQSYGIPADGEYYLHVIAEDGWSAEVEQPAPQEFQARATRPGMLQGDGPTVSSAVQLSAGALRLSWQQHGTLPFEIVLWDAAGQQRVEVVTASMAAEGATTIEVPASGVYVLNVQSNGAWTIALDEAPR